MGIRKEIPGGNLVTEYYNRIKAKTLAALLIRISGFRCTRERVL